MGKALEYEGCRTGAGCEIQVLLQSVTSNIKTLLCRTQNALSFLSLECVYLSTAGIAEARIITNVLNYGDWLIIIIFLNNSLLLNCNLFHFVLLSLAQRSGLVSAVPRGSDHCR